MLCSSECRYQGCRFESLHKFFKLVLKVCLCITHVCSFVLYNGLWLSGLSSLFLCQKYWFMLKVVGSNPATGSYSSTFILSIQIRKLPTPLPYHMYVQLPHLKSAVLPMTTCLCSSITVIPLCLSPNNKFNNPNSGHFLEAKDLCLLQTRPIKKTKLVTASTRRWHIANGAKLKPV